MNEKTTARSIPPSLEPVRRGAWRPAVAAVALLALALAGCGGGKEGAASQTAARVNKEEVTVHQINFLLQRQPGLKPEQTEAAARQALERLIDQELAVQKAQDLKLDRDPQTLEQIEVAKREILARALAEKLGQAAAKPSVDEVQRYYNDKPALFSERRIYSLQELQIEAKPEQVEMLRGRLKEFKNPVELAEFLKASEIRFGASQALRAAEQVPMANLDMLARLKDGDWVINPMPNGMQVIYLAGSRQQPVTLEQARPAIEQYLFNQARAELLKKEMKALRDAAKIEYIGKYAQPAPGAASAPAADAAAASAASGLDASAISKGLGAK